MKGKTLTKALKQRTCKVCKESYQPTRTMQPVCSPKCAIGLARKKERKAVKRSDRERKVKLKSNSDWLREAQTAINLYTRWRDKGKPCISCGKPDNGQHQRHASHYRSRGACSQLRFNLWNIHTSCATCNTTLSGNLIEYRIRLKKKVGTERVEWLEEQNRITRYSEEYLKRMKRIFNKRARIAERRYNTHGHMP